MQISLFKDTFVMKDCPRLGKQIFTRKCKPVKTLEPLYEIANSSPEFLEYRERIERLVSYLKNEGNNSRECIDVMGGTLDSMADLELLGIPEYAKQYTIVIDFSDKLDFVLSSITGCSPEVIRNIPDYDKISESLLNFDFSKAGDIPFETFIDRDSFLNQWIYSIIGKHNSTTRENLVNVAHTVLCEFYGRIISEATNIENYVAVAFKTQHSCCVYRSKTLSKVILTSDRPIDEDIILEHNGVTTILHSKSYSTFGYAKEMWEV